MKAGLVVLCLGYVLSQFFRAFLAVLSVDLGRDIGATLRMLLRSRLFFSGDAYRRRIKSPADFLIGLVRGLNARAAPTAVARAMGRLGENWLAPPSVEGWAGERAWLTGTTWLLRNNIAADLLAGRRGKLRPPPHRMMSAGLTPATMARRALILLLDDEVSDTSRHRLTAFAEQAAGDSSMPSPIAAVLHAAVALPEYQLL